MIIVKFIHTKKVIFVMIKAILQLLLVETKVCKLWKDMRIKY